MAGESARDGHAPEGRAVKAGLAAYAREDYAGAYRGFWRAAAAGNPEGQYRFGMLYARGHGVLANLADAVFWYRKAAEQGHADAQYQLSLAHLYGSRPPYGFDAWYEAAAQGDRMAADRNFALFFPNG